MIVKYLINVNIKILSFYAMEMDERVLTPLLQQTPDYQDSFQAFMLMIYRHAIVNRETNTFSILHLSVMKQIQSVIDQIIGALDEKEKLGPNISDFTIRSILTKYEISQQNINILLHNQGSNINISQIKEKLSISKFGHIPLIYITGFFNNEQTVKFLNTDINHQFTPMNLNLSCQCKICGTQLDIYIISLTLISLRNIFYAMMCPGIAMASNCSKSWVKIRFLASCLKKWLSEGCVMHRKDDNLDQKDQTLVDEFYKDVPFGLNILIGTLITMQFNLNSICTFNWRVSPNDNVSRVLEQQEILVNKWQNKQICAQTTMNQMENIQSLIKMLNQSSVQQQQTDITQLITQINQQ